MIGLKICRMMKKHLQIKFFYDNIMLHSSQSELRLPLLQLVSTNKSFLVGVQSPTEIKVPRVRLE